MFEVGFWELVILAVIVLIIAGPERLPGIVRTLGFWAGRAKAAARGLKADFDREMAAEELRKLKKDVEAQAVPDKTAESEKPATPEKPDER